MRLKLSEALDSEGNTSLCETSGSSGRTLRNTSSLCVCRLHASADFAVSSKWFGPVLELLPATMSRSSFFRYLTTDKKSR